MSATTRTYPVTCYPPLMVHRNKSPVWKQLANIPVKENFASNLSDPKSSYIVAGPDVRWTQPIFAPKLIPGVSMPLEYGSNDGPNASPQCVLRLSLSHLVLWWNLVSSCLLRYQPVIMLDAILIVRYIYKLSHALIKAEADFYEICVQYIYGATSSSTLILGWNVTPALKNAKAAHVDTTACWFKLLIPLSSALFISLCGPCARRTSLTFAVGWCSINCWLITANHARSCRLPCTCQGRI